MCQSTLKVVYGHENNESPVFRNSRRKTVREGFRLFLSNEKASEIKRVVT